MKISIISIFCPPEKGAAPYRIHNMAKELQQRGVNVEIITALANYPTGKLFKEYNYRLFKKEDIDGVICKRYWLFPSNSSNPIVRLFSMLSFAISILFSLPSLWIRRPDIVYVQSPPLLVGYIGVLIGKMSGAKVVTNISDIWPMTAAELGVVKKESLGYRFFEFLERKIYKNSDAFVGQSQEIIDYLGKKIGDKSKVLYRNLTCDIDETNISEDGKSKIVYAGLLGLAQGVANICRGIDFKKLGLEFHIYGDGVEKGEIEEYCNLNKREDIILHNPIPKIELQPLLSRYQATIIPLQKSIYGATPSKIYMAIAAGLPIIFAGSGEGANIVEKHKIGFVSSPSNIKELEYSLISFSKLNYVELTKMKNNIKKSKQGVFNYSRQQDLLYNFLKEL